jgi:FkbM family methyltransferase
MINRLFYFFKQPDVNRHPVKAIVKRVLWKLHWLIKRKPVLLEGWYADLKIILPKSGSAAQVFYRRHSSIEIVRVMERILKPGDIVVDIGAHIGEYTLIAAYLVKPVGVVYAIEPQAECVNYIRQNCEINGLKNVKVYQLAVGDRSGSVSFKRDPRSWGGLMVSDGGNLSVQSVRLDDFAEWVGLKNIAFIKIDAAGNELAVLNGGTSLFTQPNPPIIVCKLYHPKVVKERFGYEAVEVLKLLWEWKFKTKALIENNTVEITMDHYLKLFDGGVYCIPIFAWRGK